MATPVNWTLSARESRQVFLEELAEQTGNKLESKKLAVLMRAKAKYIGSHNFAGIPSSTIEGMREMTFSDYTLFYKIRDSGITVTGLFKTAQSH